MAFRFQHSLNKTDLLSLAKNISKSKLLTQTLLNHSNIAKKPQPQNITNNLLYNNIIPNKERSRSVNAMMSSLLKQSNVVKHTKESSSNLKPLNDLSVSFCTNVSGTEETDTKYSNKATNKNNGNMISSRFSSCSSNDNYSEVDTNSCINGYSCYNITKKPISTICMNDENDKCNHISSTSSDMLNKLSATPLSNVSNYSNYNSFRKGSNYSTISSLTSNNLPSRNMSSFSSSSSSCTTIITFIQLEDLIVLEEKMYHILDSFRFSKPVPKLCIEWWMFFTYSSFCGKFETLFSDGGAYRKIAHDASVLELLCIILTYECIKDTKIAQNTLSTLKNLINEVHQNFLVVIDCILSRISMQSMTNIWINKLQNIILSKRNRRIYKNEHMNVVKKNNDYISTIFRTVLKSITSSSKIDTSAFNFFFKKLNKTTIKTLNDYFRKKINQDYCKTGDSLTFIINETPIMPNITVPYLQNPLDKNKHFTLVLDLDETLISFHMEDSKKGLLLLRPGLHTFLQALKPLYELIIFTAGTQEYADPILDSIEKNEKYFEKRLYRQHSIIIENVFVKDLSKLGRDLSKVIIIDNMPHNFKLQKENGIFIKNFYGEDKNDTALIDLIPILKTIASDPNNDVRKELKRLENEIFAKITTNLKDEED